VPSSSLYFSGIESVLPVTGHLSRPWAIYSNNSSDFLCLFWNRSGNETTLSYEDSEASLGLLGEATASRHCMPLFLELAFVSLIDRAFHTRHLSLYREITFVGFVLFGLVYDIGLGILQEQALSFSL
jgi:hypothetical protein